MNEKLALELAFEDIEALASEFGCKLVVTRVQRLSLTKFAVYYDAKEWIEEQNVSAALAGNTPILVDVQGG